jgi:hypothetical protein
MPELRAGTSRASSFCHLCGQKLTGRYFRHSTGLVFCETCSAGRPRCPRCAAPLNDSLLAEAQTLPRVHAQRPDPPDTQGLCRRCLRTAPRCAACRRHIVGSWYTFEELMPPPTVRRFCETCVKTRPRCDLCRVPVAPHIAPLDDGQYRCDHCAAEMVLGDDSVTTVYDDTLHAFSQIVGQQLSDVPRIEVVSRLQMGEIRRRYELASPAGEPSTTAGHHVLGFFVRSHGKSTIYIERGLPHSLLLGTLAHELGHAWQAEHAPGLRDPLLCEGFAEWAAHSVLVARGLHAMAARAARRDDLYGRGLRHFLTLEHDAGQAGVLDMARGLR